MAFGAKKAKRRNSDRRMEHSRNAARCRRSQESEVFLLLSRAIPLSYDLVKVLDKTSIIRLSISYLKLRTLLNNAHCERGGRGRTTSGHLDRKLDHLCQRALDGFLMVVSGDGEVLYATDNITNFLGLTQVDVIGQSLFDLSHPCDHDELREMIGSRNHQPSRDSHEIFFIRMKSTITSKGRNVHIKSASYRVIGCTKHLKRKHPGSVDEGAVHFVVIVGRMKACPSTVNAALDSRMFVSRHSLDMKFTSCDERICDLIGYRVGDVIGKSLYSYYHALDAERLERSYRMLFCKGQASTGLYRFLAQHGGYVWIETDAAVINNTVTDKPEHIICVHSVVSGVEDRDTVFDVVQLASKMSSPFESEAVEEDNKDNLVIEASAGSCFDEDNDQSSIQFATEEILAQVVRQRRDSDDISLNSINKSLMNEIGDDKGSESGMTRNFSNFSLTSLLDRMDDDLEMRAPYISMDDRVFSSIDTILSDPESNELPMFSLINSDPLLSSVNDENLLMNGSSSPPPPLFVVDILDSNVLVPPRKSLGVKRPHGGTDSSSSPLKMARVELGTEPLSYPDFKKNCLGASKMLDFDNPSQTATTKAACPAAMTTDRNNPLPTENSMAVAPSGEKEAEFPSSAESPEVLEWKSEDGAPFKPVRLVSNDRKQTDVVPTTGRGAEPAGQWQNGVPLRETTAGRTAAAGKRAVAGSGRFVLKLTTPDGRVFRMMSRTDASPSVGAACTDSGVDMLGSGARQQVPVCVLRGKSIGQSPVDSTSGQHANRPPGHCLNSVVNSAIRLISPSSIGRPAGALPAKKVYAVVRQPVSQGGGNVVQNGDKLSESAAADDGRNCPLYLKFQNIFPKVLTRVTLAKPPPDIGSAKVAVSSEHVDDDNDDGEKAEDLAVVSNALPGGTHVRPLSLYSVQKSAAQTHRQPTAATSATTDDGNRVSAISSSRISTTQLGKSGTAVTIGKALLSEDRKMAAVKESKQELQRGKEGGHVSPEPDNHEASMSCCSRPTSSSYQDSVPDCSGSSVLKNLLLKGVDVNYGYRLENSSNLDVAK